MKKHYNSMQVEVSLFDTEDVIATSGETETLAQDNTKAYAEWDTSSVWDD